MTPRPHRATDSRYAGLVKDLSRLLESARRASARAVNVLMTATYWEIGRRIVEYEQKGERRASYGTRLLHRLSADLTNRFGRGFSERNLEQMRKFYMGWQIPQTLSAESGALLEIPEIPQTPSAKSPFPLPWSHYVHLLSVRNPLAREFYETEALRGGWSIRQLDRQIGSQFYERIALSRNKVKMLTAGARACPADAVSADERSVIPSFSSGPRCRSRSASPLSPRRCASA